MRRTTIAVSLLAVFAVPPCVANASVRSAPPLGVQRAIVLKLSDLRSAYLLRAGAVHYDATTNTPVDVREQLQRHFDTVIGLLLVSTPKSVETALLRLEASESRPWSESNRISKRKQLLASRYLQLQRLAYYRDRGQFPLNEGQSRQPAPIFVDEHDSACAVGQLMRWSGWPQEVASIHRVNNLIYMPQAVDSSVANWVLTSGITLEEAALIQPGYLLVATNKIGDYGPGELSFVKDGLKYENFELSALNFPSSSILLPNPNFVSFNGGSNTITTPFPSDIVDPPGNRWLLIGGAASLSFAQPCPCNPLRGQSLPDKGQRITLTFDVSTIDPNTFIDLVGVYSNPSYGGFHASGNSNYQGRYQIFTLASHSDSIYGGGVFDELPGGAWGTQSASGPLIAKTNSLSVQTTIMLDNGATLDSFVLGFNLVPEPLSCFTALIGVFGVGFFRSSRRSQPR